MVKKNNFTLDFFSSKNQTLRVTKRKVNLIFGNVERKFRLMIFLLKKQVEVFVNDSRMKTEPKPVNQMIDCTTLLRNRMSSSHSLASHNALRNINMTSLVLRVSRLVQLKLVITNRSFDSIFSQHRTM